MADSPGMQSGMAFGDVLDAALDGARGAGCRVPGGPSERSRAIATPSYLPSLHGFGEVVTTRRARAALEHFRPLAAPPRPRPRRILSMKQKDALDSLTTLGARLDADFTLEELRAAFRMLALHYHPDRHFTRSEAEQVVLAAQFARAHDAYEQLKTVAPAVTH